MDSLLHVEVPLSLDSNNNPPDASVCSENTCSSGTACSDKAGTNGWSDSDTATHETTGRYSLRPRSLQRSQTAEPVLENGNLFDDDEESPPVPNTKTRGPGRARRQPAPLSRYRRRTANARERERMREINAAFEALRRALPLETDEPAEPAQPAAGDKVTKIATLRQAIRYIGELTRALGAAPALPPVSSLLPLKAVAAPLCLTPPPVLADFCMEPR